MLDNKSNHINVDCLEFLPQTDIMQILQRMSHNQISLKFPFLKKKPIMQRGLLFLYASTKTIVFEVKNNCQCLQSHEVTHRENIFFWL